MGPVSLTVTISIRETIREIRKEVMGPKINPPMVMTTSLGVVFQKKDHGETSHHHHDVSYGTEHADHGKFF